MVQVICLVLSLVPFILIKHVQSQGYVGDFCTLQSSGAAGQCQLISNCPAAIQALQTQGIPPQTCGFDGSVPIVCCVGGGSGPQLPPTQRPTPRPTPKPTPKPTPRPTASTAPPTPKITRVGQKSELKCKEYQKYAYPPATGVSTAFGTPVYDEDECAIEGVVLIVGGTDAKAKEFAHMALIGWDDGSGTKLWQCGGSLISEGFVLTAGHCLYDKSLEEPKYVRLGELVLNSESDDAETQEFLIKQAISHPDYQPPSQYNDIALLKLDRNAKLNVYVRPACLNTKAALATRQAIASGWGKVGYTAGTSDHLQIVGLDYFQHSECNNSYKNNIGNRLQYGIVDQTQLCAGSRSESKDTCQGDSGGPLQIPNKDECVYYIVGVTSFGKACGYRIPGVYTRVSHYIGWIESIVWP